MQTFNLLFTNTTVGGGSGLICNCVSIPADSLAREGVHFVRGSPDSIVPPVAVAHAKPTSCAFEFHLHWYVRSLLGHRRSQPPDRLEYLGHSCRRSESRQS